MRADELLLCGTVETDGGRSRYLRSRFFDGDKVDAYASIRVAPQRVIFLSLTFRDSFLFWRQ